MSSLQQKANSIKSSLSKINGIHIAVFCSGTASMGIEIVAGRLIAPAFGSSIYTWGSIIGVFMLSLSLGYFFGGRSAESKASRSFLFRRLIQAALILSLVSVVADGVIKITEISSLPLMYQPLLPIILLFGPPVFVLGFTSPYAAQLSSQQSKGGASGITYSIGTLGSIVGAFSTTFFLIPSFPVKMIQLFFVILLVIGGLAAHRSKRSIALGIVVILLLTSVVVFQPFHAIGQDVVYETETPYQHLEVREDDNVRYLYLNGDQHGAMYTDGRDGYVFRYEPYMHLPELYTDDLDNVLMIGGGAYSVPKQYDKKHNSDVTTVEIDPDVVRVSERYFNTDTSRYNTKVMDGRKYLDETDKKYDVIVLDAYTSDDIPFHLTTKEFMELVKSRLSEDGVVVMNVISSYDGSAAKMHYAMVSTTNSVFENVDTYPTFPERTTSMQNVILVASQEDISRSELESRAENTDTFEYEKMVDDYKNASSVSEGLILTDDYSPVGRLTDPLNGRHYVVQKTDEQQTEDEEN